MPWQTLTADETEAARVTLCDDRRHSPPHTIVYKATRWVCPKCGAGTIVWPADGGYKTETVTGD